jgi:hypothetical protein
MKQNKIIFLLAIISFVLLATSSKANAQTDPVGACIYMDGMDFYCITCRRSDCFFMYGGQFNLGQRCCSWQEYQLKTYYPNVQQGCCSKDNTCTSGIIDMGYLQTCEGYQCNEGNYECIDNTCATSTLITLRDFKAYAKSKSVILDWSTESETDNAGFNLYRSESENGSYTKINNSLIPAKGSSTEGASYEFTDTNVQNKKTYYYKLEDIDLNGTSTLHGPVSATPRLIYGIGK